MKYFAIINPETDEGIARNLRRNDIEPIVIGVTDRLDERLAGHADLQVFPLGETIYCHPDISLEFVNKIDPFINVILCRTPLGSEPAKSIPYCIANTGKTAFHRKEYTDATIKNALNDEKTPLHDVKQGFTRCAAMIIDDHHVITEDRSIEKSVQAAGITALLIAPGHVPIRGYRHGFIGGASGLLDKRVFLTGTLDHHPDRDAINSFIETAGQSLICLSKKPAIDIGSIVIFRSSR